MKNTQNIAFSHIEICQFEGNSFEYAPSHTYLQCQQKRVEPGSLYWLWGGIGVYKQVELIALIPDQLKGIADSSTCKVDTPHIKATWRLLEI